MPAVPRRAAAGTVRTLVALSMVIVTSAVIPARTVGGASVSATVTGVRDDAAGRARGGRGRGDRGDRAVDGRVDGRDRDGRGLADAIDGEVALDDVGRDLERRRRR